MPYPYYYEKQKGVPITIKLKAEGMEEEREPMTDADGIILTNSHGILRSRPKDRLKGKIFSFAWTAYKRLKYTFYFYFYFCFLILFLDVLNLF